ncbi:hypothetical protein SAMN05192561_102327 [Halopenitus malekzadehii]|uniref:DUF447 family protein n=1 Tax=Halopenitus malekzadehii TaxID=1267564 RepID=A0A1H6ILF5_9EURY|nr:DUF447 domain-containing protein [Halopenitus malekzadehii]SEH47795.1 hypothetical protein SAMN05192561_102327 [Halopenitus malekzadehii]
MTRPDDGRDRDAVDGTLTDDDNDDDDARSEPRLVDPDRFGDQHTRVVPRATGPTWPVDLRGVTETIVATRGPNGRWNMAALGVHAPDPDEWDGGTEDGATAESVAEAAADAAADDSTPSVTTEPMATARTYGRTRTRRNVERTGRGVIQFTSDPLAFVDAALTIDERSDPILANTDAYVEVEFTRIDRTTDAGTEIHTWALAPVAGRTLDERVPRTNRGYGAVIDATVAASRLDVEGFGEDELLDRLRYFADTVDRCGGPRERAAFERIDDVTGWRNRR